jgi:multiple sugar transport system substrate-binding protein
MAKTLANDFRVVISIFSVTLLLFLAFVIPSQAGYTQMGSSNDSTGKSTVTLSAMLTDLTEKGRWEILIGNALQELKRNHPQMNIKMAYFESPYNQTRGQILKAITNQKPIDLVSVDQIWLGEFAQKGLLTDLTALADSWGRSSDWYQENWDGGAYNKKIYGIWAWTDARGIWYWKDLLARTGVDPYSMRTWDGYIASAKRLNSALEKDGIEGAILFDVNYSPDLWYPYLWMLRGDILEYKQGHPRKGSYWFPAYNSTQGVKALNFIKDQVDDGIIPMTFRGLSLDKEFVNRKFATMISGSWIPGFFPRAEWPDLELKLGFIPMFPVPTKDTQNATMMGGWGLSIPVTSRHKELAWELITIMLKPKILAPWIEKYRYLPTQLSIGEGRMMNATKSTFPYYDQMLSMIPFGHRRPNIPEYPAIA